MHLKTNEQQWWHGMQVTRLRWTQAPSRFWRLKLAVMWTRRACVVGSFTESEWQILTDTSWTAAEADTHRHILQSLYKRLRRRRQPVWEYYEDRQGRPESLVYLSHRAGCTAALSHLDWRHKPPAVHVNHTIHTQLSSNEKSHKYWYSQLLSPFNRDLWHQHLLRCCAYKTQYITETMGVKDSKVNVGPQHNFKLWVTISKLQSVP